jgi:phenylacetic acid degradation operon negative regulatory protein
MPHDDITPEKASKIWNLDKVNQTYQNKWCWFIKEIQPSIRHTLAAGKNPLDLFILYLQLREAVSELYLIDPILPKELLPPNWVAKSVLAEMMNNLHLIAHTIPDKSPYARFIKV